MHNSPISPVAQNVKRIIKNKGMLQLLIERDIPGALLMQCLTEGKRYPTSTSSGLLARWMCPPKICLGLIKHLRKEKVKTTWKTR